MLKIRHIAKPKTVSTNIIMRIATILLLILFACNSPKRETDAKEILKHLDKMNILSTSEINRLSNDYIHEMEFGINCQTFTNENDKRLEFSSYTNQFIKRADSLLSQDNLSESQIIEIRLLFNSTLVNLNNIIKNILLLSKYKVSNNSYSLYPTIENYRIEASMLKNDIHLIEIDFLNEFFKIHNPSFDFDVEYVNCKKIQQYKNGEYAFQISLSQQLFEKGNIRIDSLYSLENKNKISYILDTTSSNTNIILKSLKNGHYFINGVYKVKNLCNEKWREYPFQHEWTILNN